MLKCVYMLTLCSLSNFWSQLFEHLCLFWTFTAAEGSAPTLALTCSIVLTPLGSPLPTSPKPPCKDTPSPIPLLPKLRSTVSSKGKCKPSSFYSTEKNRSSTKTQYISSAPSPCPLGGQCPATSPSAQPSATEVHDLSRTLGLFLKDSVSKVRITLRCFEFCRIYAPLQLDDKLCCATNLGIFNVSKVLFLCLLFKFVKGKYFSEISVRW